MQVLNCVQKIILIFFYFFIFFFTFIIVDFNYVPII